MSNKPKLITVQEYCRLNNVSVQSVYARIKRGSIEAVIENGVKMIVNDYATQPTTQSEQEVNSELNAYTTLLQSTIKDQKKEIKRLHKTINNLEKQRISSMGVLMDIVMGKVIPMQLEHKNGDVIDVAAKEVYADEDRKRKKKLKKGLSKIDKKYKKKRKK